MAVSQSEIFEIVSRIQEKWDLKTSKVYQDINLIEKNHQQKIQGLHDEYKDCKKQLENLSGQLSEFHEELCRSEQQLDEQKRDSEEKYQNLSKELDFQENLLGLKLRKVKGNWMEVNFTYINKNDPLQPFHFKVRVTDGKYEIADCDPQLKNLEPLVQKVNETNDFRSLVVNMRKRFKHYVEKLSLMEQQTSAS